MSEEKKQILAHVERIAEQNPNISAPKFKRLIKRLLLAEPSGIEISAKFFPQKALPNGGLDSCTRTQLTSEEVADKLAELYPNILALMQNIGNGDCPFEVLCGMMGVPATDENIIYLRFFVASVLEYLKVEDRLVNSARTRNQGIYLQGILLITFFTPFPVLVVREDSNRELVTSLHSIGNNEFKHFHLDNFWKLTEIGSQQFKPFIVFPFVAPPSGHVINIFVIGKRFTLNGKTILSPNYLHQSGQEPVDRIPEELDIAEQILRSELITKQSNSVFRTPIEIIELVRGEQLAREKAILTHELRETQNSISDLQSRLMQTEHQERFLDAVHITDKHNQQRNQERSICTINKVLDRIRAEYVSSGGGSSNPIQAR